MAQPLRHAICNEIYQGWKFHDACRSIRSIGYEGIEIAPFTLAEDPRTIPTDLRRQYRGVMQSEGLLFVGLHWLMASPPGLHVTSPDTDLRRRSWDFVRHLIDLCADLGDHGVMVFGSPKQRGTTGGSSAEDAVDRFEDGLIEISTHAMQRHVTVLVEALPIGQCNVVTTLDQAVEIVKSIDCPSIRTMFDTHNAVDEKEPHDALVEKHYPFIRHVHVNEMDGMHPGKGDYDFKPLLRMLRKLNYSRWVSLEAFDFSFGSETIARESLEYLKAETARLDAEQ